MAIEKIFDKDRKMNVMPWGSGGLTSGLHLIENQERLNFNVVALMTNNPDPNSKGDQYSQKYSIPLVKPDLKEFKKNWRWNPNGYKKGSPELKEYIAENKDKMRTDFDEHNAKLIRKDIIQKYDLSIDLVCMSGWMLKVYPPLLDMFYDKILNVHPADLTILGEDGKPKYTGDDAVFDAIKAGEQFTYSTIHIATDDVDLGPIVVISPPLEVDPEIYNKVKAGTITDEEIRKYVDGYDDFEGHQSIQKYKCDNPAYLRAVDLISQGRVAKERIGKVAEGRIDDKINVFVNDIIR